MFLAACFQEKALRKGSSRVKESRGVAALGSGLLEDALETSRQIPPAVWDKIAGPLLGQPLALARLFCWTAKGP